MRWLLLSLLAIAGTCAADPVEDYCNKPDIPNPKLCMQTMKGQVGKDWPNTSAPRTKSKVKTGRAKPPPLAVPSVQKWFKRLPPWPQTADDAAACARSPFGKELEAAIADESQLATQRGLLTGPQLGDSGKADKSAQQDFARFENDADLQQCLDPRSVKSDLEDPYNLPHTTEALTVPLRAAHEQAVDGCRGQAAAPCEDPAGCPQPEADPQCELNADMDYEKAVKGAVQKWLTDAAPKYAADRDRVQACLNKLSDYHKAAVRAHNAGASMAPSAIGTATDLKLIKGLADHRQAYCKAATDILERPPG
jgi:hypothetical protein